MHVEALNNILHKCIRLLLYSGVYSSVYSVQYGAVPGDRSQ